MKTRIVLVLIRLLCAAMATVQSAPAATIMVTNTNDSGPGSLRSALAVANDGDTIDATNVSGTILLTSGELQITHNGTINGPGAGSLAVNGSMTFRVFENFASNVTVSGLTITNGLAPGVNGGGIRNHGGLTLNDSIVSSSHASLGGSGGGIFVDGGGMLTVTKSTISGNGACCRFSAGGGIGNADGATLTVIDSTISGNGAFYGGGGIASGGKLTVMNSTISGNSSLGLPGGHGGGMFLGAGTTTITDSTISDNAAGAGGGILNSGAATQIKDTVLNAGESGGTIFNDGGSVTSLGYNIASDAGGGVLTGPGDQINTDPILGPLQDNGGLTFTHALLPGSPAINVGDPSFTPPPFYDQRGPGFDRVVNNRIDIGSFEFQGPTATPTPAPRPSLTPRPRPTPRPRA